MTSRGAARPLNRRTSILIHDPCIPSAGGRKLHAAMEWNEPDSLIAAFLDDLAECSHGLARYEVVERIELDDWPALADGFVYTPTSFLTCWHQQRGFHNPEWVDYHRLLSEFDIAAKIESGFCDEIWFVEFPYGGFYESIMAGRGAFWCNAPPLQGTEAISRRFVMMAFNYERGVGEMLESFGHRAESIIARVFAAAPGESNLWERFTRCDHTHPGGAEVGSVHFAPNSDRDYDWGNPRPVSSRCDDWLFFPNLAGRARTVDCREWGGGDTRLHHLWWFRHFPHSEGEAGGISLNWWEYILDPNRVGLE